MYLRVTSVFPLTPYTSTSLHIYPVFSTPLLPRRAREGGGAQLLNTQAPRLPYLFLQQLRDVSSMLPAPRKGRSHSNKSGYD